MSKPDLWPCVFSSVPCVCTCVSAGCTRTFPCLGECGRGVWSGSAANIHPDWSTRGCGEGRVAKILLKLRSSQNWTFLVKLAHFIQETLKVWMRADRSSDIK